MPCQWIELSSSRLLVTFSRTSCPSRSRTSGPGTVPFTAMAPPLRPPVENWPRPIARSMLVPETSSMPLRTEPDIAPRAHAGIVAEKPKAPPAIKADDKKRRRGIESMYNPSHKSDISLLYEETCFTPQSFYRFRVIWFSRGKSAFRRPFLIFLEHALLGPGCYRQRLPVQKARAISLAGV